MYKAFSHWIETHKLPALFLICSFLFVLGGMGWAYYALRGTYQPLVIHFTERSGITEVGTLRYILLQGVFWILLLVVNTAVAILLLDRDRSLGMFLMGSTLFISILIFVWFAAIIHVN